MENKILFCLLAGLLSASRAQAADTTASASSSAPTPASSGPTASSTTTLPEEGHPIRYQAALSYITSRSSTSDYRSFRTVATDDTGQMNTSSALPNLNYLSARLGVVPMPGNTFSLSTLQSLDPPSARTLPTGSGDMHTLPGSIYSARYGYRINPKWSLSAGENYTAGFGGWSDPQVNATYRPKEFWEQGWSPRFGVGASVPTTLRSHDDRLITQATARTGLSYVAGRWTSSGSLSYSRAIYEHPSQLQASMWGPPSGPGAQASNGTPSPVNQHLIDHCKLKPDSPRCKQLLDPTAPVDPIIAPGSFGVISGERTYDRSTGSMGVSYTATDRLKFGSGAGVTYIQTWSQHAIWFTTAKILGAAYDFWKMEAGADASLFSNADKYKHPSLPSLMTVGVHLTYFMGADHNMPLN